eukprot:TRINITY_DN4639_c0_g2_i2.p2 TRINITY_DN4639_c0_g2~~TRINITY_DN4639_c0_g2_i2.p2  ORF type:complete len:232 (-),score=36.64 TRINITY_DN4639_c0_g2_i2:76-771(-)
MSGGGGSDAAPAAGGATGAPEKMAMTAPVVVSGGSGDGGAAASGATVGATADGGPPRRVHHGLSPPRKVHGGGDGADADQPQGAPVRRAPAGGGRPQVQRQHDDEGLWGQVAGLFEALARDGVKTTGPWSLQRYNPPFSLPWMKTTKSTCRSTCRPRGWRRQRRRRHQRRWLREGVTMSGRGGKGGGCRGTRNVGWRGTRSGALDGRACYSTCTIAADSNGRLGGLGGGAN